MWKIGKHSQTKCVDCRTDAQLTSFTRALNAVNQCPANLPSISPFSLTKEEREAIHVHQIEIEQKRAMALAYSRHNTYR